MYVCVDVCMCGCVYVCMCVVWMYNSRGASPSQELVQWCLHLPPELTDLPATVPHFHLQHIGLKSSKVKLLCEVCVHVRCVCM